MIYRNTHQTTKSAYFFNHFIRFSLLISCQCLSTLFLTSKAQAGGGFDQTTFPQGQANPVTSIGTPEGTPEGIPVNIDRPSFTTWSSQHHSFPQINPKNQASLWCFMKTEDGRILNLQAICGNSGNASQSQPPDASKSTHAP